MLGYLRPPDSKPAIVPAGARGSRAGQTSECAPLRGVVEQGLLAWLLAQRIYQDLVAEHGFTGAYDAVKRFVCNSSFNSLGIAVIFHQLYQIVHRT